MYTLPELSRATPRPWLSEPFPYDWESKYVAVPYRWKLVGRLTQK